MDLISCRNLLIYLEPRFAEEDPAHLPLRAQAGRFFVPGRIRIHRSAGRTCSRPVDKKAQNLFQKAGPDAAICICPSSGETRDEIRQSPERRVRSLGQDSPRTTSTTQREADRVTVNQFAPPGVLDQRRIAGPAVSRVHRPACLEPPTRQGQLRRAEDGARRVDAAAARRHQQSEAGKPGRPQGKRATAIRTADRGW